MSKSGRPSVNIRSKKRRIKGDQLGIASLFGRGDAARRTLPMPPEELLEAAVLIYLRGLGLSEGAPGARG